MTTSGPISVENEQPSHPGALRVCTMSDCNVAVIDCASRGGTCHRTVIWIGSDSIGMRLWRLSGGGLSAGAVPESRTHAFGDAHHARASDPRHHAIPALHAGGGTPSF